MTREDKLAQIENLTAVLNNTATIYLADSFSPKTKKKIRVEKTTLVVKMDEIIPELTLDEQRLEK